MKPYKSTQETSFTALRQWINKPETISLSSQYKLRSLNEKKKETETWALSVCSDPWRLMVGGSEGVRN